MHRAAAATTLSARARRTCIHDRLPRRKLQLAAAVVRAPLPKDLIIEELGLQREGVCAYVCVCVFVCARAVKVGELRAAAALTSISCQCLMAMPLGSL